MGIGCEANKTDSISLGHSIKANGSNSFGTGFANNINGDICFAIGRNLIAQDEGLFYSRFVVGAFNDNTQNGAVVVGNGTLGGRSNSLRLVDNGDLYIAGTLHSNGADYAESTEWVDGNPNEEDRSGYFVCMQGTKMRFATSQDKRERIGVVSAYPSVLGDSYADYWHGKYVTDVFGRIQFKKVTFPAELDEQGNVLIPETTKDVPIVSESFNPDMQYVSRASRKEYGNFAMLGKLVVIDDGTCQVDGYCYPNDNGIATASQDGFYVMERLDPTHIKILLK